MYPNTLYLVHSVITHGYTHPNTQYNAHWTFSNPTRLHSPQAAEQCKPNCYHLSLSPVPVSASLLRAAGVHG